LDLCGFFFLPKNRPNSGIGNGHNIHEERTQTITVNSPIRITDGQNGDEIYKGVKIILSPKKEHIVHCFRGNFAYITQPEFILENKLKVEEERGALSSSQPKDFPKAFELEMEKYRRQAKREAELRVAAEENLRLCETQLQKERERVKALEHEVHVLQSKFSAFRKQKQKREESKIAITEEIMKLNGTVGAVDHSEDSGDEKLNSEILMWSISDEQYEACL